MTDDIETARKLLAADRLARRVLDLTHGDSCTFDGDDEGRFCYQCQDGRDTCSGRGQLWTACEDHDGHRPCTCDCGMCRLWWLCLAIRPQGARDPQPGRGPR